MGKKSKKRSHEENEAKKAKRDSSSSSSSDSESSSSSSSECDRKRKKKRKHQRNCSCVKKLQKKMDLFTQNIDIKLNYMETLIQTLIKSQRTNPEAQRSDLRIFKVQPKSTPQHLIVQPPRTSNLARESRPVQSADTKPEGTLYEQNPPPNIVLDKKSDFKMLGTVQGALENPDLSHIEPPEKNEKGRYDLPVFPMTELDEFFIFDKHLSYPEYMEFSVQSLYQNCTSVSAKRTNLRVKKLIYGIVTGELLNQFTWSGRTTNVHKNQVENLSKYALCSLRGLVELTKNCVDYDLPNKIPIYELVSTFKECIKRNKDRMKKTAGELEYYGETLESYNEEGSFIEQLEEKEEKFHVVDFE
jgi:hypothetical protein